VSGGAAIDWVPRGHLDLELCPSCGGSMYSQANVNLRFGKRLVSIAVCQSKLLKRQGSRDHRPRRGQRIIVVDAKF